MGAAAKVRQTMEMDDDIDALELDSEDDDDEWTRNFEALVHAREDRTDTKRRRTESPRWQEEQSIQWITPKADAISRPVQERCAALGQEGVVGIGAGEKGFLESSSWKKAVQEASFDRDFVEKLVAVHQVLERSVIDKAPAMCVYVTSVTPNGKGSAYAYLRDESGEIGGAICTEVFDHFPVVSEGSALLLKQVPLFATPLGDVSFVLRPESIQKVTPVTSLNVRCPWI